jgi:uncharacterized protein YdeI (YjbR/CyaY-like superfamily)
MSAFDRPVLFFADEQSFRDWLVHNHASVDGVWLRFAKKGWQVTFTPRCKRSPWSLRRYQLTDAVKPETRARRIEKLVLRRTDAGLRRMSGFDISLPGNVGPTAPWAGVCR